MHWRNRKKMEKFEGKQSNFFSVLQPQLTIKVWVKM